MEPKGWSRKGRIAWCVISGKRHLAGNHAPQPTLLGIRRGAFTSEQLQSVSTASHGDGPQVDYIFKLVLSKACELYRSSSITRRYPPVALLAMNLDRTINSTKGWGMNRNDQKRPGQLHYQLHRDKAAVVKIMEDFIRSASVLVDTPVAIKILSDHLSKRAACVAPGSPHQRRSRHNHKSHGLRGVTPARG